MIKTTEGLKSTKEAHGHLERALAERASMHPQWYSVMAEPIEEDIIKLRAEVAAFEAKRPSVPTQSTDRASDVTTAADHS